MAQITAVPSAVPSETPSDLPTIVASDEGMATGGEVDTAPGMAADD